MSPKSEMYECALDTVTGCRMRLHLVRGETASKAREAATQGTLECAALKAALILDVRQAAAACNAAAVARTAGTLRTRSLHAEVVYNLSPGRNISSALKKHGPGAGDDTQAPLLLCFILESNDDGANAERVLAALGEPCPLEELLKCVRLDEISSVYKVEANEKSDLDDVLDTIITKMATKHIVSH